MGGSNFKPDVTRKGLEVYTSKGNVVQECYRHRLKKYQLEKILALCDATDSAQVDDIVDVYGTMLVKAIDVGGMTCNKLFVELKR